MARAVEQAVERSSAEAVQPSKQGLFGLPGVAKLAACLEDASLNDDDCIKAQHAGDPAAAKRRVLRESSADLARRAAKMGNQYGASYRDYSDPAQVGRDSVEENYRLNHTLQAYDFVCAMEQRFGAMDCTEMSVWEAIELLNEVVDDSDPDTALPQIEHLLQTAEAIRKAYPKEDWFHLTGLIHDLGKVLAHPCFGPQPQWAVVGDTHPVGCAPDPRIVFSQHFAANPDSHDARYNTQFGVYAPSCGLKNVKMSWGHDEYFYRVMEANGCTLPAEAKFIIRYHSFYPLHTHNAYDYLLDDEDRRMIPWLKRFQRFDLYSKSEEAMNVKELKQYYMALIHKYFPNPTLKW
ncbi:hypothetical protein WJX72_004209 [[Myrmecia] bisecta]|uniref:Inositol oxygenase n=1 Tax=[Myrmecia] bisecta TaxID=41462 RepID=A0AAW1R692_9CHLO